MGQRFRSTRPALNGRGLIDRMRARDATALGELYDQYGGAVYSIVLRIASDRTTAEDLTQEVFLRVWNRIPSYNLDRGSLSTWVLTIARHSAIDYRRSRAGQQALKNVSLEDLNHAPAVGNALADLEAASETRRVRKAMGRLSSKHRQLLELAYFEGLSQAEIAVRLEVPLGTVKTWATMAMRELRSHLAEKVAPPRLQPALAFAS